MAPSLKKRKTGTLAQRTLQAFEGQSSDEEDPVAQALELKDRGQEHAVAGRFAEARSALGQAIRLLPGSADLHELHAQVLLELGCSWEAVRAAARAVELRPTWAEAHVTLARAQLNFGEPVLAEASYERALENQPEDREAVSSELAEARRYAGEQRALGPGVRAVVKGGQGQRPEQGEEQERGHGQEKAQGHGEGQGPRREDGQGQGEEQAGGAGGRAEQEAANQRDDVRGEMSLV